MPNVTQFGTQDQATTVGAQTVVIGHLAIPNNGVAFLQIKVLATRSDGRSKAWSFEALIKKIAGTVTLCDTRPSPPTALALAADDTALAGVAIGAFSNADEIGINGTGQAGQTINWIVTITGLALST